MSRWATRWGWRVRVEAWDVERDRVARDVDLKAIHDMRKRHVKISSMMQGLGVQELKKILEKSREDARHNSLTADQCSRLIELGMKIERLNRGEPESIVQDNLELSVDDKRARLRGMLSDPEVVSAMRLITKKSKNGDI